MRINSLRDLLAAGPDILALHETCSYRGTPDMGVSTTLNLGISGASIIFGALTAARPSEETTLKKARLVYWARGSVRPV